MATKSTVDAKKEKSGASGGARSPLSRGPGTAGPALLLFLSGAAGLIYQVLWVKQLSLVVGVDVYAVTTAVSAFFGGLALGSWAFGRRADRIVQPLRLYAALEAAVAVTGIGATLALAKTAPLFVWLEVHAGLFAWLLPFALVGIPAAFMGGTLPVLIRALRNPKGEEEPVFPCAEGGGGAPTPSGGQLASLGGKLYAANTAGAIAGTLLASFALIPAFGVRGSAFVAAAFNLAAGIMVWCWSALASTRLNPRLNKRVEVNALHPSERIVPPARKTALILYAVAGGIALGYEVIWSQALVQWTGTRTFAFAVVLAVYLTGLALGSAWYARRAGRSRDPWGEFGLLIAAAGMIVLLEIASLGGWLTPLQTRAATLAFNVTHHESFAMAARFLVAASCVVLVPTFLLGAAFPAALRLAAGTEHTGRDTGAIIALNTAGGIIGTLLTGFVLVPWLGLERSLAALAVGAALVGAVAARHSGGPDSRRAGDDRKVVPPRKKRWAVLAIGAITLLVAVWIPRDHLARLLAEMRKGQLVFHETSAAGTVAVIEQGAGTKRFRRLYIQGVSNSGDALTSLRYMRLQALLPLLIHRGEPKSALVIGLGTGITAGSLLYYPGLEKRVCAELLPAVARAAPQFAGNSGVTTGARIDLRLRDGRRELLRSPETYDLITLEPPPPSAAGVVNLYSRDFYDLAATRLNRDGLLAQWLPLPTQTDADTRSLVRSFIDVFPHATLWTTELHEMLLVGSLAPIQLDGARISRRFEQPGVTKALTEVGVASPAALLATWVTDRAGLERYAADALPTTDDRPRIEYGGWVLPDDFWKTLSHITERQSDPPLGSGDATLTQEMKRERAILADFYSAGFYAYRGDQEHWQQAMDGVLRADRENPYYRWFVSGP
jgi:spermidine synthase